MPPKEIQGKLEGKIDELKDKAMEVAGKLGDDIKEKVRFALNCDLSIILLSDRLAGLLTRRKRSLARLPESLVRFSLLGGNFFQNAKICTHRREI